MTSQHLSCKWMLIPDSGRSASILFRGEKCTHKCYQTCLKPCPSPKIDTVKVHSQLRISVVPVYHNIRYRLSGQVWDAIPVLRVQLSALNVSEAQSQIANDLPYTAYNESSMSASCAWASAIYHVSSSYKTT